MCPYYFLFHQEMYVPVSFCQYPKQDSLELRSSTLESKTRREEEVRNKPQDTDNDRREGKGRRYCWGTELIQFYVLLGILQQDDWKKGKNSSYSSYSPGTIHPILHIVLVHFILFFKSSQCKIANAAKTTKKLIDSAPQAAVFAFSSVFIFLLYCIINIELLCSVVKSTQQVPERQVGHELHDYPPHEVVVHNDPVLLLQHLTQLLQVRHGVAHQLNTIYIYTL